MKAQKRVGLKVKTVFSYRGAKCYIRSKVGVFEQLIIVKPFFFSEPELYTHFFEYPTFKRGEIMQDEELRAMQTVLEACKATVDEILMQRTLKVELKTKLIKLKDYVNKSASKLQKEFNRLASVNRNAREARGL